MNKKTVLAGLVVVLSVFAVSSAVFAAGCHGGGGSGGGMDHGNAMAAPAEPKEKPDIECSEVTVYQCPMHPESVSHDPGKCPVCGMDLAPRKVQSFRIKKDKALQEADKKASELMAPASTKEQSQLKEKKAVALYACPMHPEVTSDKPGKCRKCGMKLEKQQS